MHGPGAAPPKVPWLDLKGAGLTKHSTRPLPPHVLAGTRDMYIYEWLNDSCRDDSYSDTLATSTRFTEGRSDGASAAESHPLSSATSGQSYATAPHHMPTIATQVRRMDPFNRFVCLHTSDLMRALIAVHMIHISRTPNLALITCKHAMRCDRKHVIGWHVHEMQFASSLQIRSPGRALLCAARPTRSCREISKAFCRHIGKMYRHPGLTAWTWSSCTQHP